MLEDDGGDTVRIWQFGEFVLDTVHRRLLRNGEPVHVDERPFDLLVLLASHWDRPLDRREITTALWGARPVSDNTLRQLVYKARRAVDDDGEHQNIIRTLHGRSLQWVAPLAPLADVGCEPAGVADAHAGDGALIAPPLPATSASRRLKLPRWLPAAFAGGLLLVAAMLWMNHASAPEVAPLRNVAIEPFTNATGDASFDWIQHGLPGLLSTVVAQGGGLNVLGSAPVARVWNTKLTPPADREAALRHTLGAQVLVGGSLRRLTTDMYELTVQVTLRADNQAQKMTLTGAKPARLAVDAAKRVRGILLPHQPSEAVTSALADKFFAEAYSRGMDLIHQGKMAQARTYFELCVRSAPDFLPAQLQLGESQFHTRQITQARKTLNDLVALAQKHADPGMTAQALNRLSAVDMAEQKFAAALTHAQKALTFAQRCKDKKIEAISTLHIANAASRLGKLDMAGHNLAHAHSLVERFGLKSLSPTLYNAEAFYAMARGDSAAREVADRASLRYSEATGNEANALSARYNVATDMIAQGRGTAAIPLLHKVYVDAMARQNTNLGWYAGYTLVAQLFVGGADQQALALVEKLLPITTSNKQTAKHWMTLALRGSVEAYRDDLEASLHSYRQALPLVDAKQSPGNVMQLLQYMAQAAYFVDPAALPRIAGKADAIHGAQAASLDYSWHLLHALVDAQAGRQAQSMVHMRTAAGAAHPNDPQQSDLRSVAFSLAKASKVAAAMALKDFDINQCSNAATLHDYARWAQTQGDTAGQQRAQDRIAALRKLTLSALSSGALAAVHKPPATHG